ncbi:TPA: hypothetical protein N0F65_004080, partial [Lagenidium giganteum]
IPLDTERNALDGSGGKQRAWRRENNNNNNNNNMEHQERAGPRWRAAGGESSGQTSRSLQSMLDGGSNGDRPCYTSRTAPQRDDSRGYRQPWASSRRPQQYHKKKYKVPDNWNDVPKIGAPIPNSPFVAMRVPLDDNFTKAIAEDELWTPEMFIEEQQNQQLNVRMVIDLTNTDKYHNGLTVFEGTGIRYQELAIEGFNAPPNEGDVRRFVGIVDRFVDMHKTLTTTTNGTLATNRTGYLIVTYLIKRMAMSVGDALEAFAVARPPGLIKHMYVEDLYARYAPDAPVILPDLPQWASDKYARREQKKHGRNSTPRSPRQQQQQQQQPVVSAADNNSDVMVSKAKKYKLPENWTDVSKISARISNSPFVAMRVPLDDNFTKAIAEDELWTPEMFIEEQQSQQLNVRMVIDLTNTDKYHNGLTVFEGTGIRYQKLAIEGYRGPPAFGEVRRFVAMVDHFLNVNQGASQSTIAVHCTNGLNRTGYMVVAYLVARKGMSLRDALKAFTVARPPGVIKPMFIESLYSRFAPKKPVVLPEIPQWAAEKYARREQKQQNARPCRRERRARRLQLQQQEQPQQQQEKTKTKKKKNKRPKQERKPKKPVV